MPLRNIRKRLRSIFERRWNYEIEPDEIFLDASNLPDFDESQFEGRIERPVSKISLIAIGVCFALIVGIGLVKAWSLQITHGQNYAALAADNSLRHSTIFPKRGVIYDRNEVELAWNEQKEGEDFPKRHYYAVAGLSHLLGYVSYPKKDNYGVYFQDTLIGTDGIEKEFSDLVAGINGLKIIETNAQGQIQSESIVEPPRDGRDIVLSIDSALTSALHEKIAETAAASRFKGGAGVLMDVLSGEVIALTSFPEYRSEVLSEGKDQKLIQQYLSDIRTPFLNRVVGGRYTPGSIVKPFVAMGVLDQHVIEPTQTILSTGSIKIPNPFVPGQFSVFKDWKAHGYVDLRQALAVSSDVYFYEVGGGFENQRGIGIDNIAKYVSFFGLGQMSNINLPGEVDGTIPTPAWKAATFDGDIWRVGDTYNTAIGQYGFQITPIEAVRATAALANGGVLLTPTVLKGAPAVSSTIPIVPEYFQIVREGMRLAVTEGTAGALALPTVAVAAKTGTAQVGARNEFMNSWVIGFFPYEHPRYAFALVMERAPAGTALGAPYVMRQFLDWLSVYAPEYLASP